jgi:hypothetical protein
MGPVTVPVVEIVDNRKRPAVLEAHAPVEVRVGQIQSGVQDGNPYAPPG